MADALPPSALTARAASIMPRPAAWNLSIGLSSTVEHCSTSPVTSSRSAGKRETRSRHCSTANVTASYTRLAWWMVAGGMR